MNKKILRFETFHGTDIESADSILKNVINNLLMEINENEI